MKKLFGLIILSILLGSCATKKQITYFSNLTEKDTKMSEFIMTKQELQPFDIIKIDVFSPNIEAALPYSKTSQSNFRQNTNIQMEQLEGYVVSNDYKITFPVLGIIDVRGKDRLELEKEITKRLIEENHLTEATVSVTQINTKFTVLGEVQKPGTFPYIGERISLLQALGYAGDLTINGSRSNILLIREHNNSREVYQIDLRDAKSLKSTSYFIKPNDVIIVKPNFNKIKSAGFIGSPSSISAIASIILNITILLLNN